MTREFIPLKGRQLALVEHLEAEIEWLRAALEGLLMEWDNLTRYGSPMAKAANKRANAARAPLAGKP